MPRNNKPSRTDKVRNYLKSKIEAAGLTYNELADLMAKVGLDETKPSLANKMKRGTFSAVFFFAVLEVLGEKRVSLDDL